MVCSYKEIYVLKVLTNITTTFIAGYRISECVCVCVGGGGGGGGGTVRVIVNHRGWGGGGFLLPGPDPWILP